MLGNCYCVRSRQWENSIRHLSFFLLHKFQCQRLIYLVIIISYRTISFIQPDLLGTSPEEFWCDGRNICKDCSFVSHAGKMLDKFRISMIDGRIALFNLELNRDTKTFCYPPPHPIWRITKLFWRNGPREEQSNLFWLWQQSRASVRCAPSASATLRLWSQL